MSESVTAPAVTVEGLCINVTATGADIVDEIGYTIAPGQVLGLVGESGSGKTTVGLALLGHTRRGVTIVAGRILIGDIDVLGLGDEELRKLRGKTVSYVPQDPAAALNPALRVGTQMRETLEAHDYGSSDKERSERVAEMMGEVALPEDKKYLRRFPHELSGGQQQRIGLAMAFACRPRVIVLDEPTTGLDVTTQAHVLETVRDLAGTHGTAALYVSHDLAVVATLAARVAVMYSGRIVEIGQTEQLFSGAAHPYTRRLIAAIPHISGRRALVGIPGRAPSPGKRPVGCFFAPRCALVEPACEKRMPDMRFVEADHGARCIKAEQVPRESMAPALDVILSEPDERAPEPVLKLAGVNAFYGPVHAVHDIDLAIAPRECLALVGESGSGKTTLARSISGLHKQRDGEILLHGKPLEQAARSRSREARRAIQYVFQNPYGSLNPRRTVGQAITQPLELFGTRGKDAERRAGEMLERVSLAASHMHRYPDQLSGGERQRVAIARALVCDPELLVCDEITSALDVSVQAAIVELLAELQRELGLAMLFVTHNLPLVRSISSRVAVMSDGRIVEVGKVEDVLRDPKADYTKRLLADTPSLETVAG